MRYAVNELMDGGKNIARSYTTSLCGYKIRQSLFLKTSKFLYDLLCVLEALVSTETHRLIA